MTGLPSSSCGACKFLRRKCTHQCIFAPYFSYDEAPSHFAAVHKVFGASNVSKLLMHLPLHVRSDAAITIAFQALERIRDPIYGCVSHIFALQQEVASLQEEIELLGSQIANFAGGNGGWGVFDPEAAKDPFMEFQAMNAENYQNQLNNPEELQQQQQQQQQQQTLISPSFVFEHQNLLENLVCFPW